MSKRAYISRYLCIIRKLKIKEYCSYEELKEYIDNQTEYLQSMDESLSIGTSKRTIQRDLKEIRNLFGIDIYYSKSQKGYYIENSEAENLNFQRMMEAFDVFQSLNIAQDVKPYMFAENRTPQGTEHLHGLLYAIKNRKVIEFSYHKFWDKTASQRTVEPYAIKEAKNRWYVIAKDIQDGHVKTFGLDRLKDLDIKTQKFPAHHYDVEASFKYLFGILGDDDLEPQNIILSFKAFAGKYIKTLPLHWSQKILTDNTKELKISLKLKPTYDFLMELLSHGDTLKVIEPISLAQEIKTLHKKAYENYEDNTVSQ